MTINEFLSRLETGELERLRKSMIRALLHRRKFEGARFLEEYWLLIFDATGLFHFPERHCPHCMKKVINKGPLEEKEIKYITTMFWKQNWCLGMALLSVSERSL